MVVRTVLFLLNDENHHYSHIFGRNGPNHGRNREVFTLFLINSQIFTDILDPNPK